ncbi:MAG: ATP-binding protein [Thermoplasmatota archaeon]
MTEGASSMGIPDSRRKTDNSMIVRSDSVEDDSRSIREIIDSETKYRSVLEQSPDNIYIVDMETMRIVETNTTLQRLLGYSTEELQEMTPYDFIEHEKEDIDGKVGNLSIGKNTQIGERRYRRKDGSHVIVEVSANLLEFGGRKYICVVSWDITDRKRVEKELMELNQILQLTSKITRHDIRNHLAIALGIMELMRHGHIDRALIEEAHKAVAKAIDITKRMNELEELALFNRDLKRMNLGELVESVVKDYPVKYSIEGEGEVIADEGLLSVVENIIGNSINHGEADRIIVKITNESKRCILSISDNGRGIDDKIKDKVFHESFSYGKSGGSGLGLYIVKNLVERYGGTVKVSDNKPRGTTVSITFPAFSALGS